MRALGTHSIAVDAFNASRDVSAPIGTTHLKLVGFASFIDFEAKDSDGVTVTSALIPSRMRLWSHSCGKYASNRGSVWGTILPRSKR